MKTLKEHPKPKPSQLDSIRDDLALFDLLDDPLLEDILPHELLTVVERTLDGMPVEISLSQNVFGAHVTIERPGYYSVAIHSMSRNWNLETPSSHLLLRGGVLSSETPIDLSLVNQFNIQNPDIHAVVNTSTIDEQVLEVQQTVLLTNGIPFSNLADRIRYFISSVKTVRLAFQYAKG